MQEIRRDRQGLTKGAGTGPGTRYHRSQVVQVTGRQVTGRLSLRRTGRCRSCRSLFFQERGSGAPHTVQYVGATTVKGIEVGGRPHIVLFSGEISARTRCSRRCCVSAMLARPFQQLAPRVASSTWSATSHQLWQRHAFPVSLLVLADEQPDRDDARGENCDPRGRRAVPGAWLLLPRTNNPTVTTLEEKIAPAWRRRSPW